MQHLRGGSRIIWLRVTLETLKQRVHNYQSRGIACRPGQGLDELFAEREQLYQRVAEIIVDTDQRTPESVVTGICEQLITFEPSYRP